MPQNKKPGSETYPDIGLALSGGGSRAAGFHLGCLSYLNHRELLSRVKMLSTASGGTFTGAIYVLSLVKNDGFKTFFKNCYSALSETPLVKRILEELGQEKQIDPAKPPKLIEYAAQVYADSFLEIEPGKPALFGSILDKKDMHLEEIIFNTTEFRKGVDFRFQKSTRDPYAKIGNFYMWLKRYPDEEDKDLAKKIRLADIVAASSCIPGGFEPILFPDDFKWPDEETIPRIREIECEVRGEKVTPFKEPVPIMDGGIYDNLGLDSLLLADYRVPAGYRKIVEEPTEWHQLLGKEPEANNAEPEKPSKKCQKTKKSFHNELDLVIISDAYKQTSSLHKYPREIDFKKLANLGERTLGNIARWIKWTGWGALALCAITIGSAGYLAFQHIRSNGFSGTSFLYLIPLILPIAAAIVLWRGRSLTAGIKERIKDKLQKFMEENLPRVEKHELDHLTRLTLRRAATLIWRRVRSLVDLAASVFMFRVRQLMYDKIYRDDYYDNKIIANAIYDLIEQPGRDFSLFDLDGIDLPSDHLMDVVYTAADMETEMWFDTEHPIRYPTASGQATLCFNLMKHIKEVYVECGKECPEDVKTLWTLLVEDWNNFVKDPYWLLKDLLPEMKRKLMSESP
jgi:hypothetical protein